MQQALKAELAYKKGEKKLNKKLPGTHKGLFEQLTKYGWL